MSTGPVGTGRLSLLPLCRAALAVAVVGLAGCRATGAGPFEVHEAVLYGAAQEHIVWVYGGKDLSGPALTINGQALALGDRAAPGGLPGTLSVAGQATARFKSTPLRAPFTAQPDGDRVQVTFSDPAVVSVYATDGERWTRLSGTSGTVTRSPATALRGAGALTDAEADAVGAALLRQGPLYVAMLADSALPDPPLTLDPMPVTSRRTGLYVVAPQSPSSPTTTTPTTSTPGGRVTYTELSSGTNAGVRTPAVQVATTDVEVAALYAQAYGRQTEVPTPASVAGGTVVGIFLGQQRSGGYSVRVLRASAEGGVLTVSVRVRAPGPGSITTQALTSPWTLVRVDGTYASVRVVDEFGQPFRTGGGTDR